MRRANHEKFTEECVIYKEKHVLVKKKMFTNGPNCLKKVDIIFKMKTHRLTVESSPEMVDLFNELILADRRVTIKDISD